MIEFSIILFKIGLALLIALGIGKFADFFVSEDRMVDVYGYMNKNIYFVIILMLTIGGFCVLSCLENWAKIDVQTELYNSQHEQIKELVK